MAKRYRIKHIKTISLVLKSEIFVIFASFIFAVCIQRFSNNKFSFMNYRFFSVITGSMVPVYNVGDVLIARDIPADQIEIGDDVSYLGAMGSFKDKIVTHRVIGIETDTNGEKLFFTQGVANLVQDPVVKADQIYGRIVYKSFLLSFAYKIISTRVGMFILIVIPVMYIIMSEILAVLLEKEDKKRNGESI